MFDLGGQVALVTGATRGIGWAVTEALARQGAAVVVNGRDRQQVDATVGCGRAAGLTMHAGVFDVGDLEPSRQAFDAVEREVGPVDILFANAGVQQRQGLLDFDQADFERVLFPNLSAQWSLARHAAAAMVGRVHGRLVVTGSFTALLGRAGVSAYTAAKGAWHATVRQMSAELAPRGVTVNAIAPGYIRTELTEAPHQDPDFEQWLMQRTPARRWGKPRDLAAAAVFCAARESGFFTGQTLVVDGGLSSSI